MSIYRNYWIDKDKVLHEVVEGKKVLGKDAKTLCGLDAKDMSLESGPTIRQTHKGCAKCIRLVETPAPTKMRGKIHFAFKEGQWIIAKWKHGDIDFVRFRKDSTVGDGSNGEAPSFFSFEFYRFTGEKPPRGITHKKISDGIEPEKGLWIENITDHSPMFYNDYRLEYPFRTATPKEIRYYRGLIKKSKIKITIAD